MKNGAHFCRLRDCMMVSKSAFLKYQRNVPSEIVAAERILPYYSLRSRLPPQSTTPRSLIDLLPGLLVIMPQSPPECQLTLFPWVHVTGGCWDIQSQIESRFVTTDSAVHHRYDKPEPHVRGSHNFQFYKFIVWFLDLPSNTRHHTYTISACNISPLYVCSMSFVMKIHTSSIGCTYVPFWIT